MDPNAKVALVTGAGRRIGRALALALGDTGCRVAVHYNHSEQDANEAVRASAAPAAVRRRSVVIVRRVIGRSSRFGADG